MDNLLYKRMFPNFSPKEFECPCHHPFCQTDGMEFWFLSALQEFRRQCGFAFTINSGYRCSAYNAAIVNSSPRSKHIEGIACDVSTRKFSGRKKHIFLSYAFQRFSGIGIYETFIHLDLRDHKERVVW